MSPPPPILCAKPIVVQVSKRNSTVESRAASAAKRVRRVDEDTVELTLAGREIQLRIPDKFRGGSGGEDEDEDAAAEAWYVRARKK